MPAEKERPEVPHKYRLSEKKIPFAGHNDCSGFGLVYNNPRKRNAEGYRVPSDVGLTKVFERVCLNGRIRLILVGLYL